MSMAQQFIYQMNRLTKRLDNGKELLSEFRLSFYPGAKIGIIGANGAGKSTILRIMAGIDTEFDGHTWIDPNAKIGYLQQEPKLDPSKDVRGNVMDGVAEIKALIDRYNEVMDMWADPDADYDKIGQEQASAKIKSPQPMLGVLIVISILRWML